MQELAHGGLSDRARVRARELAEGIGLRTTPPPVVTAPPSGPTVVVPVAAGRVDNRLPPPGSLLVRRYKGADLRVLVRADGFEYADEVFPSLSAVAKRITGSHCNGYLFFKLIPNGGAA